MLIVEPRSGSEASPFAGVRTILVPPDIVAVRQRPRPPVKPKPPWRPRPEAGPMERTGGRSWFSDRLFVDVRHERKRAGLASSIGAHALVLALAAVLAAKLERELVVRVATPSAMPAFITSSPSPPSPAVRSTATSAKAAPRSPAPLAAAPPPPAPVEAPASIEPETGNESSVAAAVEGNGLSEVQSTGNANSIGGTGSSGGGSSGPLRPGGTLLPPKKLKDVRPVYPTIAVLNQARGVVVIDITIDTDGKVRDAKVIRSIPQLDQAALEAVRQWEYEQTRLNGVLVSLIMTVIVNFTIQ